jgi:molybdenum cofactor cytidylyltransferase
VEIVGIVLSAGESRRMGRPKALLDFAGSPFLAQIVSRMGEAGIRRRFVAVGQHGAVIRNALPDLEAEYVTNPQPDRGQLSSLQEVVRVLTSRGELPAALVALVDHPAVATSTYRKLVEAFPAGDPRGVVRTCYRGKHGHPLLLGPARLAAALELVPTSQMREALAGFPESVHSVEVEDPGIRCDVDTPEDYARWIASGALDGAEGSAPP